MWLSPPPPVVILSTQLKVDHNDGDLGAGDDEDDEDQKQEPEEIVELILVDSREYEEEFNEAGSKR